MNLLKLDIFISLKIRLIKQFVVCFTCRHKSNVQDIRITRKQTASNLAICTYNIKTIYECFHNCERMSIDQVQFFYSLHSVKNMFSLLPLLKIAGKVYKSDRTSGRVVINLRQAPNQTLPC